LLDKDREVEMRRRLPEGVKMYTGDDFNYPELIAGGSDALLGGRGPDHARGFEMKSWTTSAPVSRAKVASSSAKKGFERPLQRYQTASPLVGWIWSLAGGPFAVVLVRFNRAGRSGPRQAARSGCDS
jgi:hypothetical protein